jgi:hypothetical protein
VNSVNFVLQSDYEMADNYYDAAHFLLVLFAQLGVLLSQLGVLLAQLGILLAQ